MEKKITLAVILALCLCLISCSNTYYDNSLDKLENIENELHSIADDLEELKPETTAPHLGIPSVVPPNLPKFLDLANVKDYLSFQVIFGDVTEVADNPPQCMAYVYAFPSTECQFTGASITFKIKPPNNFTEWTTHYSSVAPGYASYTMYLDKEGYGTAALCFYDLSKDGLHPTLEIGEWVCDIISVEGSVVVPET